MRVLTDTRTLVWALFDSTKLGSRLANLWELLLKKQRTTALLTDPLPWWDRYVVRAGVQTLGIRLSHVIVLGQLPELHRDPFDRILIAQFMVEKATLVSKDTNLKQYGIAIAW